jgi:hypothetical protein
VTRKRSSGVAGRATPPTASQDEEDSESSPGKEAKRRPHSGQELRDGARSDPSSRDPRSAYRSSSPERSDPRLWVDVIAFLGVLATGTVLIIVGHLTGGSLATVCAAFVTLCAAWKHFRTPPTPPS